MLASGSLYLVGGNFLLATIFNVHILSPIAGNPARQATSKIMRTPTYESALEYAESKHLTVNPFKNCTTDEARGIISLPLADGGQIDIWFEGEELYGEW